MKSSDVPHLVRESDKAKHATAEPVPVAVSVDLAPASESGDAAVQHLLALRETYAIVGDDAKLADVNARLANLGYR